MGKDVLYSVKTFRNQDQKLSIKLRLRVCYWTTEDYSLLSYAALAGKVQSENKIG